MGTEPLTTLPTKTQYKPESSMDDWSKWGYKAKLKRQRRLWKLLLDTLIDAPSCLSSDPYSELNDRTIRKGGEMTVRWTCTQQTDVTHTLLFLLAFC